MSWESSVEYYRIINEATKVRLGGLHSAKSVMVSVDFAEIERLQHEGHWDDAAVYMIKAAQQLERAGADCVVLCTNTMHKLADAIQANTSIPFLHIADATAERIRTVGLQTVGLLGTRFTMEEAFYRDRLIQNHDLTVLVPEEGDRHTIHRIIYDELCQGIIRPESKTQYLTIIDKLVQTGAEGIILGCTEIELLVKKEDCSIPLFPTSRIHAEAAVKWALS